MEHAGLAVCAFESVEKRLCVSMCMDVYVCLYTCVYVFVCACMHACLCCVSRRSSDSMSFCLHLADLTPPLSITITP